jgi:hypothetical protein
MRYVKWLVQFIFLDRIYRIDRIFSPVARGPSAERPREDGRSLRYDKKRKGSHLKF